ncbi:unnamed protein product [Caenorhabditis angaria]|uniref:Protein kinase domain-containing protein n=1 Tax=Caenorhabditis angaria TaxID=860376 RepID=A0A9P1J0U4_9PELO|nr:unnamed protein product [Caenorhabditis angaria]
MQSVYSVLLVSWISCVQTLRIEQCNDEALGMENGLISDSQITSSSTFDKQSVGPQNARLHTEFASGAWCPKSQINSKSYEYLQINLNQTHLITAVETQGRYGNGTGREFASEYMIDYMRTGSQWIRYRNRTGHVMMSGNFDTTTPVIREFDPPIIAQKIRIIPTSKATRTVCLRAEVHGCKHQGVIYYSTVQDGSRQENLDFRDLIFEDSQMFTESGIKRGLGLLTDGYVAQSSPYEEDSKNASWIGWSKANTDGSINILFEFEEIHNFTDVVLATFGNRIDQIDVIFSQDGKAYPLYSTISSSERQTANHTSRRYDFRVPLHNRIGKKVRITIKFSTDWMFLTEVHFTSTTNKPSPVIKTATNPDSPAIQQFLVVCGIVFLTIFSCVAYCITLCIRRRQNNNEKKCEQILKKDLIITHMGNKPSCHVFPSNIKNTGKGPFEMANDIYYARSQKSTLLSVSSKSTSSYRNLPPTWSDFNFPPPPEMNEEQVYSQHVSTESSSKSGSFKSNKGVTEVKKYPSSSLMLGHAIGEGKFTLIRECVVFGGSKVAHKSIKDVDCPHGRRALNDEIAMLMKCGKHPNIAELLAVDEHCNLILEFVELGSINLFLQASPSPFEVDFLILICKDICSAMTYLEQIGVVHGHLTPNNVLLGSDLHAKICSPRGPSHHAQLRYSAPECIVHNEFTHKSDIWSCAATIWEMSYQCQTRPYESLTNEQIVDNACALLEGKSDTELLEFPPIFNKSCMILLEQCFASNRQDRPVFEKLWKSF